MKKQIAITIILLLGIVVSVVLSQRQQIFKSRAASEINNALTVTDSEGNDLEYQGRGVYKTKSLDVQIGIRDLEQLK